MHSLKKNPRPAILRACNLSDPKYAPSAIAEA